TRFQLDRLRAELSALDLNGEVVEIDEIMLDGSDSRIFVGKTVAQAEQADTSDTESSVNWRVTAGEIQIANTSFAYEDANQPRIAKGFDYGHIAITGLQGALTDL